jgi:hypothetical protein
MIRVPNHKKGGCMPVVLELSSFDDIYQRVDNEKIIINDVDIFNQEVKEQLDLMILKNYSDDNLSVMPSCSCGEMKGGYYIGEVCSKCNTYVSSTIDDSLSFLVWVRRPEEVEKFISPLVMAFLLERYKISRPTVRLVEYMILPHYKVDKKHQTKNIEMLDKFNFLLAQKGIKRGYNSFVQNFFDVIDILEENFVKKKQIPEYNFKEFLMRNKDKIFSEYMPFPNRVIFSMESNELGKFIDKSLINPLNSIRRLTGIDVYSKPSSTKQKKVATSLIDLATFYKAYTGKAIFSKPGLIRQHISSTRNYFTARAVAVSIGGQHKYDEIYIPWSIGCTLFRPHILNRLYKRGYSYKKAINFLQYHNKIYNPILDEIFEEIISSSFGGIDAFLNRNPSLHRGSIQRVKIVKIKTDPYDTTFSISYLIAPNFNLDYDGDEVNLTLALTKNVKDNMDNFEPHHSLLSLSGPDEFSNAIKFPKTIVSTLTNWLK